MNWQDLGRKIAAGGLPALGAALAGPTGAVVGKTIAERIGAAEARPDVIEQAIAADPDAAERLAELDVELERARGDTAMIEGAAQERQLQLAIEDAQNARANVRDDRMRRLLSIPAVVFPVGFVVFALIFQPEDPNNLTLLLIGYLIAQAERVMGFFFGTSIGSAKKSQDLNRRT